MKDLIKPGFLGAYRLKLNPFFPMEKRVLEEGVWEQHLATYISHLVEPGFSCVDVGANAGFHTIAMAHYVGETGCVYAFEPNTLTFPRLVDNLNLNPILKKRVVVEKLGLSDCNEVLRVYQSGKADGNAYVSAEFNPDLWNAGTPEDFDLCIVTPLDEYLAGRPVAFMKVDVEGMELEVLRGAKQTIVRDHPIIVYETLLQDFDNEKIRQCCEFLKELGYQQFFIKPGIDKLIPCDYPNLAEDTLAMHESRLIYHSDILVNAAQFRAVGREGLSDLRLDLTIVGLFNGKFMVTDTHDIKSRARAVSASRRGYSLRSEPAAADWSVEIDIFTDTLERPCQAKDCCEGVWRSAGREVPFQLTMLAGQLFDWPYP